MIAAKILVGGAALLLACVHSPNGYAQIDGGPNENANGDGSVLSAVQAEGAVNRVDLAVGLVEQPLIDQAVVDSKYTRIIGSHHQITVAMAAIDSDIDTGSGLKAGDLRFGYSYTPKQNLSANPWVPSAVGSGFGLSIPTGDLEDGSGTGSWILAPRLGFVSKLGPGFVISPSFEFLYSFAEETGAPDIRVAGVSAQLLYVNPNAFWLQWTPLYGYDLELDGGEFGSVFGAGKLFARSFAISIDYGRVPVFKTVSGGVASDHANTWTLGFHFPFNYGQ